ncbi:MAG: O-antigen ligase family protein [Pleurocapsa sp.]
MLIAQNKSNTSNIFRIIELVFSIISLVHISQAIVPLLLTGGASEGDGVSVASFDLSLNAKISLLIYFITFALLILRWKKVFFTISINKFLWMLMGIVCFSYFWSVSPAQTFRFSIYAVGTTAFGLYLATRYTLKEQFDILAWTYGLMIVLSIVFAVALPQYGIMGGVHEGAFRGIFTHKNQFGAMMVPAGVIFLLKAFRGEKNTWIYWLLLAATCALMVLSRSTTALGTLGIMLLLCLIYRIFRWRYEVMVSAILAVTVVALVSIIFIAGSVDSDSIFSAVGKDTTLSGRTFIWQYVWDQIQKHFWFGYGLAAFWNGFDGPSGYIQLAMRVEVVYAHNGFLDIWLSIGLVGLSIFAAGYFTTVAQSLTLLRKTNTPEGFWPLLFLTYILLSNLTEGTITTMNSSFWAIYTAISYSLIMAKNNGYLISE